MKKTLLTTALLFLISGLSYGQTEIFNLGGGGAFPAGWSTTNNILTNDIDKSTYYLVEAGDPSDIILSPEIDLSSYSTVTFSLDVASYGGGTYNPAKIEFSTDGGATFPNSATSTTTTGSSYIDGGDHALPALSNQVVIRITNTGIEGRGVRLRNLVLEGTLASGAATKLVITAVNSSSSPSTGTAFDVTIEAQDASDIAANVDGAVNITLSKATGTGTLAGTLTGTIADGTNSVTISGVTYDTAETGVSITATDDATTLTAGTSATFDVLAAADTLVLVSAPTTGTTDVSLSSFTVEARRTSDDSKDLNYTKSITISKASGTGTLGGTVTKAAVAGVATFDDLTFDTAGDFTIEAADGSLTSAASATVTISDPEPSYLIITGVYDGPLSGGTPKGVELFATADIADLSTYALGSASNGGGSAGEEYTFPADAVSAGTFIYVASESTQFANFFGFAPTYTSGVANINGDDAIELFQSGVVVDVYGDVDVDGSGQSWDHLDGWGYRKIGTSASTTFNSSDWTFSGTNALDGESSNSTATTPFPLKTYTNGWFAHLHGSEGWRLLSTPTSNNSYDDLLGDIWTQGSTTGADVTTGDANVKSFNDTEFVTVDDLTANMTVGAGFAVYVYSDDDYDNSVADAGFPKTLSVSGTANTGSVSPTINTTAAKFNLVGNPYTSTIDSDDFTRVELYSSVWVYDSSVPGYVSWNGTTGGLTDGLIMPFQGFWIQNDSSATDPSLTIEEADKTTGGTFFKSAPAPVLSFRIDSETQHSQTYFSFTPDGKMGSDNMDALKLTPLDFVNYISVASESEDRLLDINNLPRTLEEEIEIPISINAMKVEGTGWVEREEAMTITWPNFDNIPTDWVIEFVDYQEEVRVDLREEVSYQFTSNSGVSQEKKGSMFEAITPQKQKLSSVNRFALVVRPSVVNSNEVKELPSVFALEQNYPNPFNPTTTVKYSVAKAGEVQLSVYNMMGQKVADLVSGTKQAGSYAISWNAEGMASGMYFYRLSAAGQTMTRQMTLIK